MISPTPPTLHPNLRFMVSIARLSASIDLAFCLFRFIAKLLAVLSPRQACTMIQFSEFYPGTPFLRFHFTIFYHDFRAGVWSNSIFFLGLSCQTPSSHGAWTCSTSSTWRTPRLNEPSESQINHRFHGSHHHLLPFKFISFGEVVVKSPWMGQIRTYPNSFKSEIHWNPGSIA